MSAARLSFDPLSPSGRPSRVEPSLFWSDPFMLLATAVGDGVGSRLEFELALLLEGVTALVVPPVEDIPGVADWEGVSSPVEVGVGVGDGGS